MYYTYYISGYIVKKPIPVLQCPNYIKTLIDELNNINDFTNTKNRGGFQLASESVFKIVKLTEKYF